MIKQPRWRVAKRFDRVKELSRPRSKKIHEYTREDAVKMRRKVFFILAILAIGYFFYFLFYSSYFIIAQINVSGQLEGLNVNDTISKTKDMMITNRTWPFSGENYFTLNIKRLQDALNQTNALASFKAIKKFPRTLEIQVEERLGRLLWVSSEQFYALEASGLISGLIAVDESSKSKLPLIYDLSNTPVVPGATKVNDKQLALIMEIYLNLKKYDLPQVELDYFKVDSPEANYVKIVTKKGFEIHVNYLSGLDSQMKKLKKSLASGKIDLNSTHYINLRIDNQVIYK